MEKENSADLKIQKDSKNDETIFEEESQE